MSRLVHGRRRRQRLLLLLLLPLLLPTLLSPPLLLLLLLLLPLAPLLATLPSPLLLAAVVLAAAAGDREGSPSRRRDARGVEVNLLFGVFTAAVAASVPVSHVVVVRALLAVLRLVLASSIVLVLSEAALSIFVLIIIGVIIVVVPASRRRHGPSFGVPLDDLFPLDRHTRPGPTSVDRRDFQSVPAVEDEVRGHRGDLSGQAPRGPGVAHFLFLVVGRG